MIDVVALDELLIDFTCQSADPDGYPTMVSHPGGAPANFLAALAKFGAKLEMMPSADCCLGLLKMRALRPGD